MGADSALARDCYVVAGGAVLSPARCVWLVELGVRSLEIFGSIARGEAAAASDVDLLVEFDRTIGLFHFIRAQRRLQQILGCRVDLVMRDAVKAQLRERILGEAIRVI